MVDLKIDLPTDFLKEEERCGYVVTSKMKEIWAVQLDLLNEFMRVCDKYGIIYYMDAGTILGAVRHSGFIPWDDDIDVMMMRDQYDRLCEIAIAEFEHPYFFQTEYTDKGTLRGHAQLRNSTTTGILEGELEFNRKYNQGIFLDIFPIDAVPDDEDDFEDQLLKIKNYRKRANIYAALTDLYSPKASNYVKRTIKGILHFCLCSPLRKIFDYHKEYMKYEELCSKYNNQNTKCVAKFFQVPMNKTRRVWPRTDFESRVYLPFEMLQVPVPSGYEDILNRFYGEWRKFIIGTATHGGVIYDTELSYIDYLKRYHKLKD